MKIQYVGKTSRQFDSKHEITYSQLGKPTSLDMYDINIFSLQNIDIWNNKSNSYGSINCINDFRSICKMIENSKKSINIIAFPQNYTMRYSQTYDNSYLRSIELKDMISDLINRILAQIIPASLAPSYDLIYENSITPLGDSVYKSSFSFIGVDVSSKCITKCQGSDKITTLKKRDMLFTTLDLSDRNIKLDDFIKGIGLDTEKTEIPEWLADLDYFDDSTQKASITDSEAKIIEFNEQIAVSKEKIKENLKYKSILVSSGGDLVEVVFEMLEKMLCYDLSKFIDEKREDFVIEKDGVAFVGEIKGVNSNVKYGNVSQTETHCKNYMDVLESENRKSTIKGVLIINTFRKTPLDKREPVNQEQIDLAKKYDILIITTETFLKLYEMFIDNDINGDLIENILKTKIGLLEVSDFASRSNEMVDNSSYTI